LGDDDATARFHRRARKRGRIIVVARAQQRALPVTGWLDANSASVLYRDTDGPAIQGTGTMRNVIRPFMSIMLLLPFALMFTTEPVFAQLTPSEAEQAQARIDAAARAHAGDQRYKGLSLKERQGLTEFVAGNMLFALLHEMGHAIVGEMGLYVLGKDEDAADSFAAARLIGIGSGFSDRVLAEAAKGWFMTTRRDKKEGDSVPPYDAHGLDIVRAYQIVCFMVGSNEEKFKHFADETKLPKDRQDSCAADYNRAANSWGLALNAHLRAPDQPKTKIDVIYGDGKGNLEGFAPAILKVAFSLWLFDFLIFEQFWWNGEGGEGLAQELPGGKDNIGCQGEEIGEEAGSLCGCLSCGAPRRVEALEERMPGEGEKV